MFSKENEAFQEFLKEELDQLSMTHRYEKSPCGHYLMHHFIEKVEKREVPIIFGFSFSVDRKRMVARILAEPDTPIHLGPRDAFRIQILDEEAEEDMNLLVAKFNQSGFGVAGEVTYQSPHWQQ